MEPFLPSEIARLVYGYLVEAKCDDAAQSFLEHCPHLSECLAVNKEGKGFNTRPAGCCLTDVLDEYCEIRRMVAERLLKLPKNSAEKLRQCGNLIGQLQYLIDATQSGQTLLVSIMMPPQESSAQRNSSSVTSPVSARNRMRILGFSDGVKRSAVRSGKDTTQHCSKDVDDRLASISTSMSQVEATPLENLPGFSGVFDTRCLQTAQMSGNIRTVSSSGQAAKCVRIDRDDCCSGTSHEASPSKPSTSSSSQCKKFSDNGRTSKYQQLSPCMRNSSAAESQNSSPVEDGPSCFSSPKRKFVYNTKRKCSNPTPAKGINIPVKSHTPPKVRCSYSDDNESSESLDFSALTQALLDNKELHKKIAENINRVIHKPVLGETVETVGSHLSSNVTAEPSNAENPIVVTGSCDGMLQELNQTIKTIVEQTEQDPVFERFLDEIIGPLDEEMTPSPAEMQSEGDDAAPDLAVTTKEIRDVSTGSEGSSYTTNKKSASPSAAITDCSKDHQQFQEQKLGKDNFGQLSSDVPLKQRLRSARQHKCDAAFGSNSVSPTAPSGKDTKKEVTSLEDQNAAAIQCIVDAKIASQKTSEISHSHQTQKNDCTTMSASAEDTQTLITPSSIDNSSEKPCNPPSHETSTSPVVVNSLQKETNQILDASDRNDSVGSSDTAKVVNNAGEVILFDGNLAFVDNSASFSHIAESGSNILSNSLPLTTQLTPPFVVTSQPSVSTSGTSQVMTITIPGSTDAIQQAASLSGISLYSPPEVAVPHDVATQNANQVVSFAIPDTHNIKPVIHEQDLMSVSTVIVCGNDGLIPQFISLPHQDSLRDDFLLPGSGGTRYVPIVPRDTPVTTLTSVIKPPRMGAILPRKTDVCQPIVRCPISTVLNNNLSTSKMVDPKLGTLKQAETFTSQRKKQISSINKKKGIRNRIGVRTRSQVNKPSRPPAASATCTDDRRGDVRVMCSNTGQQSTDCSRSLPSIILESPPAKLPLITAQEDGVTICSEAGRERLLGALNLKESTESCLNSKPASDELDADVKSKSKIEADGNKSIKSKSDFILQNVDKYPPSPHLMTLVNLSKNFANTGHSISTHIPGTSNETTGKKCSEDKLTQKSRETPQPTTSRGRAGTNDKRMSLSTPRRQRHVRALDFTTPPKARTVPKRLQSKGSSPKTSEKLVKTLRRTTNSGVSKVRSTLFKSPQNESETVSSDASPFTTVSALPNACSDICHSILPPIATRSPLPQLCGGWDNAAGVGQIICDDSSVVREEARLDDAVGSSLPVTETQDKTNLSDKQSEVTERSTSLLKNWETGHKVTPKLAEGSLMSNKNLPRTKKAWDSDLRVHVNVHREESQLPTNDKKKTKKEKESKPTKSKRKSSQEAKKEVSRLEEHLNKNESMDNGNKNTDPENTNRVSENMPSSSDISVRISPNDSEETDLGSEAKNQKRDLNTAGTVRVTGKSYLPRKGVELTSESVEKLSVKPKTFVALDTLTERKDLDQLIGEADNQGTSDRIEAVKEDTKIQRKENLALETADSNEVDLSKSSDSSTMETVSPNTSVGPVLNVACSSIIIQSPTKLKGAEGRIVHRNLHVHQSPNVIDNETLVIHTDDTSSVTDTFKTGCELKGNTVTGESAAEDQCVHVLENQELVPPTSEFCPSDSQKEDIQMSQNCKSSSSKEPSFASVPDNASLRKLRTQTEACDTANRSDAQPKSVTDFVLDTPRKTDDPGSTCWGSDFVFIPLTPRMMSPYPDDTPVTKLADGNSCIDFSLIQTPSFPPTPNIAVTPQLYNTSPDTPSSYARRSTDRSSCSPYYKPTGKLDSAALSKPLEQLLVEECRKLENSTVRSSDGYNKCHKEDGGENAQPDSGQGQPLPVPDKSLEKATSLLPDHVTNVQVKAYVGKKLVSGKTGEGRVDSLVGAPTKAPSPEKKKQAKEMTQKRGTRDRGNTAKSDHTNIKARGKVRSLSRTSNKGHAVEVKPSETCSSARRKASSVSRAADRSSDHDDESMRAQISASGSAKKKSKYISKTAKKSSDFIFKSSETHTSTSVSMKNVRTANKSNDLKEESSETRAPDLITRKEKARSISRAANKDSDLKDELSETQINPFKRHDEKTTDEIIQRHLEAARMKLFGYNSPSDDSDFESSNDFGQTEAETKTIPSNVWNKTCTELTKAKQSVAVTQPSKFYSSYSESSKTNTQQTVEPQTRADEVRPVSGLSLMKENSQRVPTSTYESELRKTHADENVNCVTPIFHSEIPRFKIFSECNQSTDAMKKSSVHIVDDDSVGAKSHNSHSAGNTTLNSEHEKKHHIEKSEGLDVSSVPNCEVKMPEEGHGEILSVKAVLNELIPDVSMGNNPMCDVQDVDARKQLIEKENIFTKTAQTTPTEVIRGNCGECTPPKRSPHLSVEAIADRLTRDKVAIQAHPMKQTPVCQSMTYEDSSSEDFPALHLSSDDDTQSECITFFQVESEMAKMHGVEEATADVSTVRSSLSTTEDVCKDLELTPNRFNGVESNCSLLHAGVGYESGRQEQSNTSKCKGEVSHTVDGKTLKKKMSATLRQESTNRKIKALLGDDVSPIRNQSEVIEVYKDVKGGILHKLFTATNKHDSPVKNTLEIKPKKEKQKDRSEIGMEVEKVQENEVSVEPNIACESNKMKTTKSHETSVIELNEAVDSKATAHTHSVDSSIEGVSSLDKSMIFEQHQVSDNETYIGIVYAGEGPKGNNLVFEDISNFSLAFELGEDSDGAVKTYKCIVSEFQELFCALPKQCTRESNSFEGGQTDITRKSWSSNCKKYKNSDCVKSNKDSHKELFHKSTNDRLYSREHRTRSRSPTIRRSTHFSHDRRRTSHVHRRSPSPVRRRRSLSHNCGRRSQSWDHRRSSSSSSSSPVTSTPKMKTFSPLTELYNDYLRDERKFGPSYSKRVRDFSFRSNERLPFGQRGRGKMKYDRHIHSKRTSRESSRTSASPRGVSDSHSRMLDLVKERGPSTEKRFTQEVRATETRVGRGLDDTALLARRLSAAEDMDKVPARAETQIKDVTEGRQKVQDTLEPLEEGELVDDDSLQAPNKYKCNDKRVLWPQKYPSSAAYDDEHVTRGLVGRVRAENFSENSSSVLKVGTRANSITSDLSLEHSKSVEDKPSQETENTQKIFQKEASFAGPSSGRALPPKKRKASSEELLVPVGKRIRTDGPQALLKKVDLDHLLDFVHGEKPG